MFGNDIDGLFNPRLTDQTQFLSSIQMNENMKLLAHGITDSDREHTDQHQDKKTNDQKAPSRIRQSS